MGQRAVTEVQREKLLSEFEENCQKAATAIKEADYFLFATGAGFSADSGLAVYKDIADVEAYRKRSLTYADLCEPFWLETEPELFYGFWGSCFNDYRSTDPHEGYHIIKRWRDRFFTDPNFVLDQADELKERIQKCVQQNSTLLSEENLDQFPDAHMVKAGFKPTEVDEIHGYVNQKKTNGVRNTETWQCSDPFHCGKRIWKAPENFEFKVNKETMLAEGPSEDVTDELDKEGFGANFPVCIYCKKPARPSYADF